MKFMAVQCFGCSMMQVKQVKKSSNKWDCMICNEKQSVRKVFATSESAKDVRGFVQQFNLTRGLNADPESECSLRSARAEENSFVGNVPPVVREEVEIQRGVQRQNSSKWQRFLAEVRLEDDDVVEQTNDDLKFVTALPDTGHSRLSSKRSFRARIDSSHAPQKGKISRSIGSGEEDWGLESQVMMERSNGRDPNLSRSEIYRNSSNLERGDSNGKAHDRLLGHQHWRSPSSAALVSQDLQDYGGALYLKSESSFFNADFSPELKMCKTESPGVQISKWSKYLTGTED